MVSARRRKDGFGDVAMFDEEWEDGGAIGAGTDGDRSRFVPAGPISRQSGYVVQTTDATIT